MAQQNGSSLFHQEDITVTSVTLIGSGNRRRPPNLPVNQEGGTSQSSPQNVVQSSTAGQQSAPSQPQTDESTWSTFPG